MAGHKAMPRPQSPRGGPLSPRPSALSPRSIQVDVDGVPAERERQALALGFQLEHHAVRILEPQLAYARIADHGAVAALSVSTGEVGEILEIVDVARGGDLGEPDSADAEPADLEAIGFAAVA